METRFINKKIISVIVFCGSIILIAFYYLTQYGTFYLEAPDANQYLSIPDNLILNGHFIQNYYPETPDFIVPFGFPLILLCLKAVVNSTQFIVFCQYILFGISNLLVFRTSVNISQSYVGGILGTIIYIFTIMNNPVCGPAYILTENYTLFVLVFVCFWLSVSRKNIFQENSLLLLDIVLFVGYVVRPVLSIIFIPWVIFNGGLVIIRKFSVKKYLIMMGVFVFLLIGNTVINYRETGEWIFMENYSAYSIYLANNSNTKTTPFASSLYPDFIDDYGLEVHDNTSLTMEEKDKLFAEATKKFFLNNFGFCVKNAIIKFFKMFIQHFGLSFYIMQIGFIVLFMVNKERRMQFLLYESMFWALSIITSFGLNIDRYAIVALPFYSIFISSFLSIIFNTMCSKIKIF